MKRSFLFVVFLVCILTGYVFAQNKASQITVKEGIFQLNLSSSFNKVTGNRLKEFKKQMMEGGQELAQSSKSADPKDINEKSLSFFSVFETPDGKVNVFLMGGDNSVVMSRDEMYKTNKERIEWGKNSGRLSKNTKGVSKLMIDNVPCLLMDIETISGGRLLSYLFFVSEYPKYGFQVAVGSDKNYFEKNERELNSIISSIKIVRSR